jgi:hypothetical protein
MALLILAAIGFSVSASQPSAASEGPTPEVVPPIPPTATVGPQPTAPARPATAELARLTFDSDADLARLTLIDFDPPLPELTGNWQIKDGQLHQLLAGRARNSSSHLVAAVAGDAGWRDYTLSANFYDVRNGLSGLVAYYTPAGHYRIVFYNSVAAEEPEIVLEKIVGDTVQVLASAEGAGYSNEAWHTLTLSIAGTTLSAEIDGASVLTAEDSQPLTGGQAGVLTRAFGAIFFDELIITTP